MQQQEKKPVIVVSEERVYHGVRTRFAYVWVYAGPYIPVMKAGVPVGGRVLAAIAQSDLTREERAQCKKVLATLSPKGVHALSLQLRRLISPGSR